jgi:CheY-like chemotaxis protein
MTTVLLVEDNSDLREILSSGLTNCGYFVLQAANGMEALTLLEAEPKPALIVSDLKMPLMNGFRLVARLKASPVLAKIPVILSSGEANLDDIAAAIGVAGFITKPASRERIMEAVAAALA